MTSFARVITAFSRNDVITLIRKSKRVYSDAGFDIKRNPRKLFFARVLIVIPKKFGNSPQRNLFRRRIKAIFYQHKLYVRPYDLVIYGKKHNLIPSFEQLKEILLQVT